MSHNPLAYTPTAKSAKGKGPRTKKAKRRREMIIERERLADERRTARMLKRNPNHGIGEPTDTRPAILTKAAL